MQAVRKERTLGEVSEVVNSPIHKVAYVVRTRNIEPCGVVGILRLFDDAAVERIASELRRIDEVRGSKAG